MNFPLAVRSLAENYRPGPKVLAYLFFIVHSFNISLAYFHLQESCMYWEKGFPRLLSNEQLQELMWKGCPLVGLCDITCDIGDSLESVNQTTSIDSHFFRFSYSVT
uniref:Uncharacterized protein n=1 Tax=Cannabis sativa TaxID=3483 RepID=A0A803R242_CANSA